MPIYAYKCESCGFAKDVLQKMSDALLSVCPQCNAPTFKKQLTAAGFQLKGSGWYVTDFKGGNNGAPAAKSDETQAATPADAGKTSSEAGASSGSAASPAATPSATTSSPASSTSNTGNHGAPKTSS